MEKHLERVAMNKASGDVSYWLRKSHDERMAALEFLRRQLYLVQGFTTMPRMEKVLHRRPMKRDVPQPGG